ncbi:nucleoside triphosphate pyrophosphohydrolase [Candidatus Marinamargulisbacteria bacterium SCGC AG-343-D04]|nr:nucleoside triphosphate pyrophosphohydrolase [Candidatus Marinamargulisbacteria bacterium SCGC AG-343-D04]
MLPLKKLLETVRTLRSPNGCPWDREQTFQSLIPCLIEEAYELSEALENNCKENMLEECGDVLLQVVMISILAEEKNYFSLDDIATCVNQKMIRRHPHVFGDKKASSVNDVLKNWEDIKKIEKNETSAMSNIPKLPALMKATKIQKKASKTGFDWPDKEGPLLKLDEEIQEFKKAYSQNNNENIIDEAGDILFSLVNCLRKLHINPEEALQKANQKFINRFQEMEKTSKDFKNLTLEEKENLWQETKKKSPSKH